MWADGSDVNYRDWEPCVKVCCGRTLAISSFLWDMKRENKLNLPGYELTMNAARSVYLWVALGTPELLFSVEMILLLKFIISLFCLFRRWKS